MASTLRGMLHTTQSVYNHGLMTAKIHMPTRKLGKPDVPCAQRSPLVWGPSRAPAGEGWVSCECRQPSALPEEKKESQKSSEKKEVSSETVRDGHWGANITFMKGKTK